MIYCKNIIKNIVDVTSFFIIFYKNDVKLFLKWIINDTTLTLIDTTYDNTYNCEVPSTTIAKSLMASPI